MKVKNKTDVHHGDRQEKHSSNDLQLLVVASRSKTRQRQLCSILIIHAHFFVDISVVSRGR